MPSRALSWPKLTLVHCQWNDGCACALKDNTLVVVVVVAAAAYLHNICVNTVPYTNLHC